MRAVSFPLRVLLNNVPVVFQYASIVRLLNGHGGMLITNSMETVLNSPQSLCQNVCRCMLVRWSFTKQEDPTRL